MVIPGTHMGQWLTRRTVLTAAAATVACTKSRSSEGQGAMSAVNQGRMPVLFMGHGNPMNAIEDSQWTRSWQALAKTLPTPRAILSVSAHWFVPGTFVTSNEGEEAFVRRDSMLLKGEGMIGFGKVPEAGSTLTVKFSCEE